MRGLRLALELALAIDFAVAVKQTSDLVSTHFIRGNLGTVSSGSVNSFQSQSFADTALETLKLFLSQNLGATGTEDVRAAEDADHVDSNGNRHVRYHYFIDDLKVEGAALMMHISGSSGKVFAINGEYAPTKFVNASREVLPCGASVDLALLELGITDGEYLSECIEAAIYAQDGLFHKAWSALIRYTDSSDGDYIHAKVFASTTTGEFLALHPQTYGARSLKTFNCKNSLQCTTVVSKSSKKISTGKKEVDDAHNHAVDTYNFYLENFGRDSLDNKGMAIVSNVNFDKKYNNAYFDGFEMYYGGGDGVTFTYFSKGLDVCAHELTHGVTYHSSSLIYARESGALNEAMSDIMGATVERIQGGKDRDEVFLLGEDLFLQKGRAVRDMSDPARLGGHDYYPDRYLGEDDKGGVHYNSGIANLAFQLMVEGGTHPRNKTRIKVPAISSDFDVSILEAARIFYKANTACLTPSSNFASARECTITHAGQYAANVAAAWTAVGVLGTDGGNGPSTGGSDAKAIIQCMKVIKKKCNCSTFQLKNSNCWKTTASRNCKVQNEATLLKRWQRYCKRK